MRSIKRSRRVNKSTRGETLHFSQDISPSTGSNQKQRDLFKKSRRVNKTTWARKVHFSQDIYSYTGRNQKAARSIKKM